MKKVWAVARNTIAQALRMKIAGVVIILLLILLPMMSLVMIGDGTLLGKLQTFSSYSLSLVGLMLCVLTIAISTFTLSDEIKRRQIFMVVTKPVSRWTILLGKFLGVVLIDVFLLIFFASAVYGLTCLIPYWTEVAPQEYQQAQNEFFTAREGIKVVIDNAEIQKRAKERYQQMEKDRRLPETMTPKEIKAQLFNEERIREQSIEPGRSRQWDFNGVRPASDPNALIFVRYKYDASATPPDGRVFGLWSIGDLQSYEQGTLTTPIYNVRRDAPTRSAQEFAVPAGAVAKQGYLGVGFVNSPELNVSTVMVQDLEILYKVGSFTENYCRMVLLLLIRLIFLAVLGIVLTTWLSFPVAILVCTVIFGLGTVNGFIVESFDGFGVGMGTVYHYSIQPLLSLLPRFDGDFSPTKYIISGRMVRGMFLLRAAVETIGFKAFLLMLLGMWVFRSREVAKTAV
ncbi:MAG: ABC transporter permease [Planctomycetes bacterium]|nr:ABC transporter permease [Planctomycetota bacterium]